MSFFKLHHAFMQILNYLYAYLFLFIHFIILILQTSKDKFINFLKTKQTITIPNGYNCEYKI